MNLPQMIFPTYLPLGYKQHQQDPACSLATGNNGDAATDGKKKKNHCIFKDSCFIWSSNNPKQCLT